MVRPPSEAGEFPKYPPAADFNGTVRRVPDEFTLAQAYAASEPGDVISIDDGTLAGNFTFSRDFAAPGILIKGRNVAGGCNPRSILPGSYTVSGDGHWFHHLRLTFTSTSTGSGSGHPFNVIRRAQHLDPQLVHRRQGHLSACAHNAATAIGSATTAGPRPLCRATPGSTSSTAR